MPLTSHYSVPPKLPGQSDTWAFVNPPMIEGPTFEQLVENVIAYKTANGIAIGNVVEEIENQICQRYPQGCGAASHMTTPTLSEAGSRCVQVAERFIASGGQLVDQNEADRRAEICANCHNNVGTLGEAVGCKTCGKGKQFIHDYALKAAEAGIAVARATILQNRQTRFDGKIGKCSICLCDNKLSAWLPLATLGYQEHEKNAFPTFCFKKDNY